MATIQLKPSQLQADLTYQGLGPDEIAARLGLLYLTEEGPPSSQIGWDARSGLPFWRAPDLMQVSADGELEPPVDWGLGLEGTPVYLPGGSYYGGLSPLGQELIRIMPSMPGAVSGNCVRFLRNCLEAVQPGLGRKLLVPGYGTASQLGEAMSLLLDSNPNLLASVGFRKGVLGQETEGIIFYQAGAGWDRYAGHVAYMANNRLYDNIDPRGWAPRRGVWHGAILVLVPRANLAPLQSLRGEALKRAVEPLIARYFGPDKVEIVKQIIAAESGWNPQSVSSTDDWGLLQINATAHWPKYQNLYPAGQGWDKEAFRRKLIEDIEFNIKVGSEVYRSQGWRAWSVVKQGKVPLLKGLASR